MCVKRVLTLVHCRQYRDSLMRTRFGAGTASGLVVVGGGALYETVHEPVAIGEAPGLAAQLQAIAPPDAVVIGASTRHLVRGLFDYREVGLVALEGFAEPVAPRQGVGGGAA